MKVFTNIIIYLLTVVIIQASAGVVILTANCVCDNSTSVGLYINPDKCDKKDIHHNKDHAKDYAHNNCNDCHKKDKDCACKHPESQYYYVDDILNAERLIVQEVTPIAELSVLFSLNILLELDWSIEMNSYVEDTFEQITPYKFSNEFLIEIHQLKIDCIA